MKMLIVSAAAAALGFGAGAALAAAPAAMGAASPAFAGHQFASQAKVSLARAREIALKARPGAIASQELEKEGGGSGLRYSFDVNSRGRTYEVGVDAKSGKVLENDRESAAAEAAETRAESHGR